MAEQTAGSDFSRWAAHIADLDLPRPQLDELPEYGSTSVHAERLERTHLLHLLSNTAGFPHHGIGSSALDKQPSSLELLFREDNDEAGAPVVPVRPPTTRFYYSGGGFTVAELAMEAFGEARFAELAQQRILGPLGMTRSTFHDLPVGGWENAAVGTDSEGESVERRACPGKAAGGLRTTAGDYARFVAALLADGGSVLSRDSVATMMTPRFVGLGTNCSDDSDCNEDSFCYKATGSSETVGRCAQLPANVTVGELLTDRELSDNTRARYGLGVYVSQKRTPENWPEFFEHGGSHLGFKSHFRAYRGRGAGVVILTNGNSEYLTGRLRGIWEDAYQYQLYHDHRSPEPPIDPVLSSNPVRQFYDNVTGRATTDGRISAQTGCHPGWPDVCYTEVEILDHQSESVRTVRSAQPHRSGVAAQISLGRLPAGSYRWRARTVKMENNTASEWLPERSFVVMPPAFTSTPNFAPGFGGIHLWTCDRAEVTVPVWDVNGDEFDVQVELIPLNDQHEPLDEFAPINGTLHFDPVPATDSIRQTASFEFDHVSTRYAYHLVLTDDHGEVAARSGVVTQPGSLTHCEVEALVDNVGKELFFDRNLMSKLLDLSTPWSKELVIGPDNPDCFASKCAPWMVLPVLINQEFSSKISAQVQESLVEPIVQGLTHAGVSELNKPSTSVTAKQPPSQIIFTAIQPSGKQAAVSVVMLNLDTGRATVGHAVGKIDVAAISAGQLDASVPLLVQQAAGDLALGIVKGSIY